MSAKNQGWQSMSERRKQEEKAAMRTATPSTPTKPKTMTLTPVPIPGRDMPRTVQSTTPLRATNPAPPPRTPHSNSYTYARAASVPPSSSIKPPVKGILKTPDRERFGGQNGNGVLAPPQIQTTTSSDKNKNKKKRASKIAFMEGTKRGPGY